MHRATWCLIFLCWTSGLTYGETPVAPVSRFEAEGAALSDGAVVQKDVAASGGAFAQIGRTGSIAWHVTVPVDGRYELILRYRTGPADRAEVLAVNDVKRGIGFSMSATEWVEVRTVRHLKQGDNQITLSSDWGQIDIDLLRFDLQPRGRIEPLVELPQVHPQRNTYCRGSTDDLQFFLEPGGQKLKSVAGPKGELKFTTTPFEHVDDALLLRLDRASIEQLGDGTHAVMLSFEDGVTIPLSLDVRAQPPAAPWTIVTLNIDHGEAVVMKTPSGKIAIIDTAKAEWARKVLVPFLHQQNVKRVDYLFITHFHDDHAGGLPQIKQEFEIGDYYDYNNVRVKQTIDVDGIKTTVLNSRESGDDENPRSLALRMELNGFVYLNGGDNYGQNEEQQLQLFPHELLRANLVHANHHFHGSVDSDFYRVVDPQLVVVSAQQAVYARGAFAQIYREKVEQYLKSVDARLRETLLTVEVGHIVTHVWSRDEWTYETTPTISGIRW